MAAQGEPVRGVALPTAAFIANRRGYPTLPKAHQELLIDFWRQGVQVCQGHGAEAEHVLLFRACVVIACSG